MMKTSLLFSLLLFSVILASCHSQPSALEQALHLAGENRQELEKVLDHYEDDTLKYQSVVYLIKNMPYHSFQAPIQAFDQVFDSISNYPENGIRREVFGLILDSASQEIPTSHNMPKKDIQHVAADFLIENIDLAFEAWQRIPEGKRALFEEFLYFILPYRNSNEPLEPHSRKDFYQRYQWVYPALENQVPFRTIVDSILRDFNHINFTGIRKSYPLPLSKSQIEKSRLGLCQDAVNYFVQLFRALGIICTDDAVPQWGNHHYSGHSWIHLKYGNEEYATDIGGDGTDLREKYKGESIPKVYRRTFHIHDKKALFPLTKDVTDFYTLTVDLALAPAFETSLEETPYLYVFNVHDNWSPVTPSTFHKGKLVADNIGTNVLYISGTGLKHQFSPLTYPFYLDSLGNIHSLKPKQHKLDSVPLLRKYGLATARNHTKLNWLKGLNGTIFQAANTKDFSDAITLFHIGDLKSTHLQRIRISSPKTYQYARFYTQGKESYLAKMFFLNLHGDTLSGKIIQKDLKTYAPAQSAFDNNPLTFAGGKDSYLGIEFPSPQKIGSIGFQARNDDNHIRKGDTYQLYLWDKGWQSMGTQTAQDTVLFYTNLPENGLYWLRNRSRGTEEHVFTIDPDKEQIWFGFDAP